MYTFVDSGKCLFVGIVRYISPLSLLKEAEEAARSGDLRSLHPADPACQARKVPAWDELRM